MGETAAQDPRSMEAGPLTEAEKAVLTFAGLPHRTFRLNGGRTAWGKAERALVARGLIERVDLTPFYRITAAGRAALLAVRP